MSVEHLSRAELRAGRQSERRSGRGYPRFYSQIGAKEPAVKRTSGSHLSLKELGRRVPVLVPVILSSFLAACEGREESFISEPHLDDPQTAVLISHNESADFERKSIFDEKKAIRAKIENGLPAGEETDLWESNKIHVVSKGESLYSIGNEYEIPWQMIYIKNFGIVTDPSLISQGENLILPSHEEVDYVTQKLDQKGQRLELIVCREPSYFPETGHFVRTPYLDFYLNHGGSETIGQPISEPIGSGAQFFERMALMNYGSEGVKFMKIGEITVYLRDELAVPVKNDFALDQRFDQFYQSKGGEEVFGYPITGVEKKNGWLIQYTQNARFELNLANGELRLGFLGQEFAEEWQKRQRELSWTEETESAFEFQPYIPQCNFSYESEVVFFEARRALEEYLIQHPEIVNQPLIKRLRSENPEKLNELFTRAQAVMGIIDKGYPQVNPENLTNDAESDWRIFKYHWGGDPENPPIPNYEQVVGVLAKHHLEYENNPLVQRALLESRRSVKAINRALENKAEPEWFFNNEIPLIPENWQNIFVFAGGNHTLGGGRGYYFPTLFGAYNEYDGSSPDDYQNVLKALSLCGNHELIHARIQSYSAFSFNLWQTQPEEIDLAGLLLSENRKFHLSHMAISSLTAVGQEVLGLEPGIEPRIVYIYSVLKRAGVSDPYGEIVRAAITDNSDRLWELYESNRNEEDISLDKLLETIDPDPEFSYYSAEELEAFRAEYFPYLGK